MSQNPSKTILSNPFPGLRAFEEHESHLFFGRKRQITGILEKLEQKHFVSVVGNSGSGKSSLIRAGVIPQLKKGFETFAGKDWEIITMRPGNHLLQNLAKAIGHNSLSTLQQSEMGLIQTVREYFPKEKNLLLLVDQFEEIFRETATGQAHFVKLITEITRQKNLPLYIIVTLRSDFIGDCAAYEGLPEAINEGQYLIPRLSKDDLREAITGPIAVAGGKISPRLVQHLLAEINYDQDELPLLQHVMMRSWDIWVQNAIPGDPLDDDHYQATGGILHALSHHADEALAELGESKLGLTAKIFKAITTKTADNRGIRRPTPLSVLCDVVRCNEKEAIAILDVFRKEGRAFVTPAGNSPLKDSTVIDISHESLMRAWGRLRAWVDEEAESAELYERLSKSAILYKNKQAALWRDPELQLAADWRDREEPNRNWAEQYNESYIEAIGFLDDSIVARKEEFRAQRSRRRVFQVIGVILVIALSGLSFWAVLERNNAEKSASEARKEKSKATEQEQVAKANEKEARKNAEMAETQRQKAEYETIEASKQRKLAEQNAQAAYYQKTLAEQARSLAVDARRVSEREREKALEQKKLADKLRIDAENAATSVKRLRKIDVAKRIAVKSLQMQKGSDPELKALLALQAYQFTVKNGGFAFNNDLYNALHKANQQLGGESESMLLGHTDLVRSLAFEKTNNYLASAGSDGKVILWDTENRRAKYTHTSASKAIFSKVAFSADGKWLAAGTDGGQLLLFEMSDKTFTPKTLTGKGKCLGIVFKDNIVCSIGEMGVVSWDLGKWNEVYSTNISLKLYGGSRKDEVFVVTKDKDEELRSILINGNSTPRRFATIPSKTTAVCMLQNKDNEIVAGLSRGTLVKNEQQYPAHDNSPVSEICLSADKTYVASASYDGTMKIWLASSLYQQPITLDDHDSWVICCTYNNDGSLLASGGKDKTIRLYKTSTIDLDAELRKRIKRQLSKDEWNTYIGNDVPYESLP